jgi:hypothetical protein
MIVGKRHTKIGENLRVIGSIPIYHSKSESGPKPTPLRHFKHFLTNENKA